MRLGRCPGDARAHEAPACDQVLPALLPAASLGRQSALDCLGSGPTSGIAPVEHSVFLVVNLCCSWRCQHSWDVPGVIM